MQLVPLYNPLAYPVGLPGRNSAHVANSNGPTLFSGVALDGGFTGIVGSRPSIVSGAPSQATIGILGGTIKYAGGLDRISSAWSVPGSPVQTLAVVFQLTDVTTTQALLVVDGSYDGVWVSAGSFLINAFSNNNNTFTLPILANVPYFAVISMMFTTGSSCLISISLLNLRTGAILSQTITGVCNSSIVVGSSSALYIGNSYSGGGDYGMIGYLAAVAIISGYLSIPQQMQWAADYGSFWYPNRPTFINAAKLGLVTANPVYQRTKVYVRR